MLKLRVFLGEPMVRATNCAKCGKKFGFIARVEIWKSKEVSPEFYEKVLCLECAKQLKQGWVGKHPLSSMKESEYKACTDNLGLLEGEEMKLQFVCSRQTVGPPSVWDGRRTSELKKGLLVFTTDNMIFKQKEGKSDYSQALRAPLEEIMGISGGGTFIKRLRILVGARGSSEYHEFIPFAGQGSIDEIRCSIEKLSNEVRQEKKRLAQEALAKGTVPQMIFCRFCGTRNKSDQSHCENCGAPLT